MTLLYPIWLLLIPALLLIGLVVKPLVLFTPLRITIVSLVALLLAQPMLRQREESLDLWVLLDRSASASDLTDQGFPEWKKILENSKPSKDDRLFFMDFASEVSVHEVESEHTTFLGKNNLTKTKLALDNVIARLDENRSARIAIFTDGYATEPLYSMGDKLARLEVPVDYRLVNEVSRGDFQIQRLELPNQTQVNEPFIIGVTVQGSKDGEVPLIISRDGQILKETPITIKDGVGKIEFTTRLANSGSYAFGARINPSEDSHEGNNTAEKWLQVMGGPRILLVTNYVNDPLIQVLAQQSYQVEVVTDSKSLKIGSLLGAESVIFNNVPAHEVPGAFLKALPFYIEEQGGGFLMIGGERSFAAGGYYESALDPVLPITMELKNDHRKLSVAMAIAIDRSGSMAMGVDNSFGGQMTKMELANNGAAEAINLLGYNDQVALFAVDTQATKVIPLQSIRQKKEKLKNDAMRVVSEGGGIFVYEALKAAWEELKKSPLSTRHIILFGDARDSTNESGYKALIKEMVKEKVTISVIGLGQETDSDADLLKDIAKRGGGRAFFTDNPLDIPQLFAQETVAIARSAFIKEMIGAQATGKWLDISSSSPTWLPTVDGYNLSYAREDATVSLLSTDEYKAPLIAHWQRGAGRVASVAFPLGGEFSKSVRNWKGYGDLSQTLLRWLNGDAFPPGLTMRQKLQGTSLQLNLYYDTSSDKWAKTFAKNAPKIIVQQNQEAPIEFQWKRIAPGQYSFTQNLEEGALIKGAVKAGNAAFPFGPLKVDGNTEWKLIPERVTELKAMSQTTKGQELVDLTKAWVSPQTTQMKSLLIPGAILILVLSLLEAFVTQTGINLWSWKKASKARSKDRTPDSVVGNVTKGNDARRKRKSTVSAKPVMGIEPTPVKEPVSPEPSPSSTVSRADRFARAKRK